MITIRERIFEAVRKSGSHGVSFGEAAAAAYSAWGAPPSYRTTVLRYIWQHNLKNRDDASFIVRSGFGDEARFFIRAAKTALDRQQARFVPGARPRYGR